MKIDIYMSCPVCITEGYNTRRKYWLHACCGGILTLDHISKIECKKCKQSWYILNSQFKCGEGRHDFTVASTEGLAAAISTSSHFVDSGGIAWLQSVLKHI